MNGSGLRKKKAVLSRSAPLPEMAPQAGALTYRYAIINSPGRFPPGLSHVYLFFTVLAALASRISAALWLARLSRTTPEVQRAISSMAR